MFNFNFFEKTKLLEKWSNAEKYKNKEVIDDGEIHNLSIQIETYMVNDFINDIQNNKNKYHFIPNGYFVYDIQSVSMGLKMACSDGEAIQVKITGRFTKEIKLIEKHIPQDIIYKDSGETLRR